MRTPRERTVTWPGRTRLVVAAAATSLVLAIPVAAASPAGAAGAGTVRANTAAPGVPGAPSYFDLGRKDCVGTAAGPGSKAWYTVAGGVLSDVYEPTIDNTNVSTLQYIVTDGATFTDLQTRDMSYTVTADDSGMSCTVTSTDAAHGFQLVTTYLTDPARDTVVLRTQLRDAPGSAAGGGASKASLAALRLYARVDAHVNGNGGGGGDNAGANTGVIDTSAGGPVPVIFSANTTTNAVNRDYAVPTYMALAAAVAGKPATGTASVGYAGTGSDGLTQLDSARTLTGYDSAPDGHVTATQDVTPRHGDSVTLALGFGRSQAQSVSVATQSLRVPFGQLQAGYRNGWARYDAGLRRPASSAGAYYLSANVLKASEDKTYPGAIV